MPYKKAATEGKELRIISYALQEMMQQTLIKFREKKYYKMTKS